LERFHDKPPLAREQGADQVGPYTLLAEVARGELSTVLLARRQGALGPRLCALKRLKPAFSKNPDWIELLLDEARLVSSIHHANIAGVLDVGTDAGSFVVMEYIEGDNLESLLNHAGAARHPRYIVPPFVDVLNGLHALHCATDDDGAPCGIVHQAPRARHIQLGLDGVARLIDFSQMRAKSVRPTRARNDRLKVGYMAPEQALHPDGVDLRADLFIVGVALWEALTGERLFAADTDEQTFQNLLHRRISRPSEVGLRPPRCFDAICMRALERDPKARYGSAAEMARELRETAQQQALYATPQELGRWVRHLAGRELRERRRLAGQDMPSSNEILLDTPGSGIDLATTPMARLPDGLTALASKADAEDPYATGRIYGGSQARIALDDAIEHDKTPAFGLRRKPLPREEEDDEPTGQHVGSGIASVVAHAEALEQRARAATVPLASPAGEQLQSAPKPAGDTAAAASPPGAARSAFGAGTSSVLKVAREDLSALRDDDDQTQPSRFVPARPGARRDSLAASPGAYSQVDSTRRAQRTRSASAASGARAAGLPPAARQNPFDDDSDTQRHSSPAPASTAAATPLSEPVRRSVVPPPVPLPAPERRHNVITEHPPLFSQRRDSSPSKLEIPDGPIGAPHKHFPSEHLPSRPRSVVEANMDSAAWQKLPPVVLPDSLTPPSSVTPTTAPRALTERSSTLWLVSGVLAALILLGVGFGLKQWRGAPGASHAASTGPGQAGRPAPERTLSAAPAAPAPAQPVEDSADALAKPEEPAKAGTPPPAGAEELPSKKPRVRAKATPEEVASDAAGVAGAQPVAPKRPAPRRSALPDNPY
jgi:serine/threonine protein kinase